MQLYVVSKGVPVMAKNYDLVAKCKKCGKPIEDFQWRTLKDGKLTCNDCKPCKPEMVKPKVKKG